jgi:hypothetical protein
VVKVCFITILFCFEGHNGETQRHWREGSSPQSGRLEARQKQLENAIDRYKSGIVALVRIWRRFWIRGKRSTLTTPQTAPRPWNIFHVCGYISRGHLVPESPSNMINHQHQMTSLLILYFFYFYDISFGIPMDVSHKFLRRNATTEHLNLLNWSEIVIEHGSLEIWANLICSLSTKQLRHSNHLLTRFDPCSTRDNFILFQLYFIIAIDERGANLIFTV